MSISEIGARESDRRQADARGVPATLMMPRIVLMLAVLILVLLGVVMVFSSSVVEALANGDEAHSYVVKQAIFAVVGIAIALVVMRIPHQTWLGGVPFWGLWGVAMVLVALVPVMGTEILGAKRWILIGGFSLQPTEFAKIMFVIAAAKLLCEFRDGVRDFKQVAVLAFVLIVIPLAFLYKTQSDMGSAMVILMGVVAVMWVGEVPGRVMGVLVVGIVVVGVLGMTVGYRAERIANWLNPWADQYGDGYQMIRSFYAFSEGGLFGVGLGNSREKFLYLPEAETDFIFSIIGEELGLLGTLSVIVLFLAILYAGLRIAHDAPDDFGRMLAGGLTVMLVGQAFLNMACVTGLFPTTGKPLPFVSSGGSSMIASLIMVGLILSVSRGSNVLTPYERRRNNLNVISVNRGDEVPRSGEGAADRSSRRRRDRGVESLSSRSRADFTPVGANEARGGSGRSARAGSSIQLGSGRERSYYEGRASRRSSTDGFGRSGR